MSTIDRKLVASGLWEALERADREFRSRFPTLFSTVDLIVSDPERVAQHVMVLIDRHAWRFRVDWCGWCGDTFVAEYVRRRWPRCCSRECANQLRAFESRRRRRR